MQFTYRAKQDQRTEASGVVEAVDLSTAVSHLRQMGLYPLEVVPLGSAGSKPIQVSQKGNFSRASLVLWARTVGQGLQAGLSLTQSLHLLAEQEQGRPVGEVARVLEQRVVGGMSLAGAMEQLGDRFSPVATHLVRAGEASGSLEPVLAALAVQVEGESELIEKVRGALIYPLFVLAVAVLAVIVQDRFVVPKLALLFTENGQQLPWVTRLMIGMGRAVILCGGIGLISLCAAAVIQRLGWGKFSFARWGIRFLNKLPVFGQMIDHAEIARLSSTLSLLLEHGLPLPESLRLRARTVTQPELKNQIGRVNQDVVEGMSLSTALRRAGIREPFLLTMITMGEAQGDMARSLRQAADRYHHEVDRKIRVLSSLIEPVIILLVGLIVGGIVFSMLMPIFQINFTGG